MQLRLIVGSSKLDERGRRHKDQSFHHEALKGRTARGLKSTREERKAEQEDDGEPEWA